MRRFARWLVIASFSVMVTAAIAQVISRYVFAHPLGWTEEVARLMLVWWAFVGAGLLAFDRKLLAIDAVLLPLGARQAHGLLALGQGLCAVTAGYLAWLGFRLVRLAGTQSISGLDIPYYWLYLSLPAGLLLATVAFAWRTQHHARRALDPASPHPVGSVTAGETV